MSAVLPLLLLALARAGGPPPGLLPLLEPPGTGGTAPADPACRPELEGLELCFTLPAPGGRRLVTRAELAQWGTDLDQLAGRAAELTAAGVDAGRPEWTTVQGDTRRYLLSARGDGLDQAGYWHPEALARRLGGGTVAIGLPARDVFIAFRLGDQELERILAVGIRRAWETLEHPLSPLVYAWDEEHGQWVVWGQAVPPEPAPAGEPAPATRAEPEE